MFQRLWVRISAPFTGWTFFTYICCKNCNDVCLKRPKIKNDKRGRGWPIFKNTHRQLFCNTTKLIVTIIIKNLLHGLKKAEGARHLLF